MRERGKEEGGGGDFADEDTARKIKVEILLKRKKIIYEYASNVSRGNRE